MEENKDNWTSFKVCLPISLASKVDVLARIKEFPSRSALIMRACEKYIENTTSNKRF